MKQTGQDKLHRQVTSISGSVIARLWLLHRPQSRGHPAAVVVWGILAIPEKSNPNTHR
jgi:hypothetical protein